MSREENEMFMERLCVGQVYTYIYSHGYEDKIQDSHGLLPRDV